MKDFKEMGFMDLVINVKKLLNNDDAGRLLNLITELYRDVLSSKQDAMIEKGLRDLLVAHTVAPSALPERALNPPLAPIGRYSTTTGGGRTCAAGRLGINRFGFVVVEVLIEDGKGGSKWQRASKLEAISAMERGWLSLPKPGGLK